MRIKILSVLFVVLAISCKSQKDKNTEMKELENANFDVIQIQDKNVENKGATIHLDLEEKRIGGNTGCNSYGGELKAEDGNFEMGMPMATKRYCEERMDLERDFLKNMGEAQKYTYDGKILELKSKDDDVLIIAKKTDEKEQEQESFEQ